MTNAVKRILESALNCASPRLRRWLGHTLIRRHYDDLDLDLQELLSSHTCAQKIIASTADGTFAVSVRDKVIGKSIAQHGVWEPVQTALIKRVLSSGDLALDLGANLGWHTVIMGKRVGELGHVLAFEPDPDNFQLLSENVSANGIARQTKLFELALLEESRTVWLRRSAENLGDHQLVPDSNNQAEQTSRESALPVRSATLDSVLEAEGLAGKPVKLIKVDCQGSEVAILEGAVEALKHCQYLFLEYSPALIEKLGYEPKRLVELLAANFSHCCLAEKLAVQPDALSPIAALQASMDGSLNEYGYGDWVFAKTAI